MRVPDISRRKNASKAFEGTITDTNDSSNKTIFDPPKAAQRRRRSRRCDGPNDIASIPGGPSRSTRAQAEEPFLDGKRSSCSQGKAFYKCASGYTGCCSVNPCTAGNSCPDDQSPNTTQTTKPPSTNSEKPASPLSINSKSSMKSSITTKTSPSLVTASSSSRTSSKAAQSLTKSGKSPPACPEGNRKVVRDSSGIAYRIHCNAENTFSSNDTISVGVGGYGECFSACSKTSSCAGFTYIGLDSGKCYLKSQMPRNKYSVKEGNNYVSCAKIHPSAYVPQPGNITQSMSDTETKTKTPVGAIVGAVIGGVLVIGLLLFLIAFCVKRKKKQKEEERRGTIITQLVQEPIETQQLNTGGHQRQVSTSHDVYAPYGGFYRSYQDGATQIDGKISSNRAEQIPNPARLRAKDGPMILPATVYRRPGVEKITMLDGTPIEIQTLPRFQEDLAEFDDTHAPSISSQSQRAPSVIADSPTLGRETPPMPPIPTKQRVMCWNNYDPHQSAGRDGDNETKSRLSTKGEVSPDSTNEPSDGQFNVSPLSTWDRGRCSE